MIKVGDRIVLKKEMGAFRNIGEECEVTDVQDDVISFKFGGGLHFGCMSEDELDKYFTVGQKQFPSVDEQMIDSILAKSELKTETVFDKCTVVSAKLPNGFVIVESSASVSPENYDAQVGREICLRKIRDRIWELEGYRLQEALSSQNAQKSNASFDLFDW